MRTHKKIGRRSFNLGTALGALALTRCTPSVPSQTPSSFQQAIAYLEPPQSRLGVAILDTQTGTMLLHRDQERFVMCSTFKLPLAALVLRSADQGDLSLGESIAVTSADLVPHAPVVEQNLQRGSMTVEELARAAQVESDNAAANVLLRRLGGLPRMNQFFRDLGDQVSRLDDYEPLLNGTPVGGLANTTTPHAMAHTVARIFSGTTLSPSSEQTLKRWLMETRTGSKRLRAGLPKDWQAGDKTGTNLGKGHATRYNDVACVWFDDRAPLILASYLESTLETETMRDEPQLVLARVGAVAARWTYESK